MNDQDMLSIALHFIIATSQTPLMVQDARRVFNCDQLIWEQDGGAGEKRQLKSKPCPLLTPIYFKADSPIW